MPIPPVIVLYPLNTQVITITGLQDIVTGTFLNAATVTATLLDQFGNIDPDINQLPLSYVLGSSGQYQGVVADTFNAKLGSGYTLRIQADQAGVQALYSLLAKVALRNA